MGIIVLLKVSRSACMYMSPGERKRGRTPVPRKIRSENAVMEKQLTLDQMVVKQGGLGGISVDGLNYSDRSEPQVETGFAVGGGHDTLDLKR